ncbi:MAG: EAL domain-containing protein, partial [Dermatophilaceae bacterium]
AAYLCGLWLQGGVSHRVVDVWLSLLTSWLPAAVCWVALARVGLRRWEVLLAAAAVTAVAAGDTYYAPLTDSWSPPFPSPGDVGYLLFYVLMLGALALVVRHDARGQSWSVWLDAAVGSLGAAAVLAVILNPVLADALTGSLSAATVIAVAYPMLDLLFIATVVGMAAVRGVRGGDRLALLMVGLVLYAVADVIYALQVSADTYTVGSPLDGAWTIGITLIALYVDGLTRRDPSPSDNPDLESDASGTASRQVAPAGRMALIVPTLATAAGLGVLLVSSRAHLSTLAVALAGVTLLAAAARTQVGFRQLVRMADLRRQAVTDDLTGLPNRRALNLQAEVLLADPRHKHQALLMMDLNKFKDVNDKLGHGIGDQLLVQVGSRLSERLRGGDLLVRLGGDEFAVLIQDAVHDQAVEVARRLCAALHDPFDLDDNAVHTAVSIGIALFPDDGPDLATLLRKADVAMYKAKASACGSHVYGDADDTDFATRLGKVEELRTALSSKQLVLHYQPKVDLRTGEVRGVETLVRWDHPTRGLLYPDAFLDLVEETGLIHAMTMAVLEIAMDQAAVWLTNGRPMTIAVNLSASSMVDGDLPEQVAAVLEDRALPPSALQLEITEDFLMADRDLARSILTRLRGLGIQISVDDFGTGYSSLSYLRDLPIDELKLDRSFILPMVDDPRAAALVASTITFAHGLDLRIVAEGVENELAYAELTRLGCDQAQGYYICGPVPAAELEDWLNRPKSSEITVIPGTNPFTAPD